MDRQTVSFERDINSKDYCEIFQLTEVPKYILHVIVEVERQFLPNTTIRIGYQNDFSYITGGGYIDLSEMNIYQIDYDLEWPRTEIILMLIENTDNKPVNGKLKITFIYTV